MCCALQFIAQLVAQQICNKSHKWSLTISGNLILTANAVLQHLTRNKRLIANMRPSLLMPSIICDVM